MIVNSTVSCNRLRLNLYFPYSNQINQPTAFVVFCSKVFITKNHRVIAVPPAGQVRVVHTLGRIVPQHQHRIMGLNYLQSLGNKMQVLIPLTSKPVFFAKLFWNLVVNSTTGSCFMAVRGSYRLNHQHKNT